MALTELDIPALFAAVDRQRRTRSLTWRQLALSLQVSPSTFTRMAQGNRPDADTFLTLVAWLGVTAETFASGPTPASNDTEPLAAITSYLRASRKVTAQEAEALSNIIAAAYDSIVKDK
jgi:transcriptional regulator with XRE-family HTH domain